MGRIETAYDSCHGVEIQSKVCRIGSVNMQTFGDLLGSFIYFM